VECTVYNIRSIRTINGGFHTTIKEVEEKPMENEVDPPAEIKNGGEKSTWGRDYRF